MLEADKRDKICILFSFQNLNFGPVKFSNLLLILPHVVEKWHKSK